MNPLTVGTKSSISGSFKGTRMPKFTGIPLTLRGGGSLADLVQSPSSFLYRLTPRQRQSLKGFAGDGILSDVRDGAVAQMMLENVYKRSRYLMWLIFAMFAFMIFNTCKIVFLQWLSLHEMATFRNAYRVELEYQESSVLSSAREVEQRVKDDWPHIVEAYARDPATALQVLTDVINPPSDQTKGPGYNVSGFLPQIRS